MWTYYWDSDEKLFCGPVSCSDRSLTKFRGDTVVIAGGEAALSGSPASCSGFSVSNTTQANAVDPALHSHDETRNILIFTGGVEEGDAVEVAYRELVVPTVGSVRQGDHGSATAARSSMQSAIDAEGEACIRLGPSSVRKLTSFPGSFGDDKRASADKQNAAIGKCYVCDQALVDGVISHLESCWMFT